MRYDFKCESCQHVQEVVCLMSQKPDVLACAKCAGEAHQVFVVPQVVVKNAGYTYSADTNVRSFGRRYGRTDQQQHDGYRQRIEAQRKHVAQHKRSLSSKKDSAEYLGCAPMEMVHGFGRKEKDPEAAHKDPVGFLKANDLYMGE